MLNSYLNCNSDKCALSLAWFETNGHKPHMRIFTYPHTKGKNRRHDCSERTCGST